MTEVLERTATREPSVPDLPLRNELTSTIRKYVDDGGYDEVYRGMADAPVDSVWLVVKLKHGCHPEVDNLDDDECRVSVCYYANGSNGQEVQLCDFDEVKQLPDDPGQEVAEWLLIQSRGEEKVREQIPDRMLEKYVDN